MIIAGLFIHGNVALFTYIRKYLTFQTFVSTPTWTILHDERHFSNPHEFIPERWIDNGSDSETCNKRAYLPFSTGLRNCIGKPYVLEDAGDTKNRLAMLQMRLLIAIFVWSFDAELIEEKEPLYEDRFVARRGPLNIRVTPIMRK